MEMEDLGKGSYNELKEVAMVREECRNNSSLNRFTDCRKKKNNFNFS